MRLVEILISQPTTAGDRFPMSKEVGYADTASIGSATMRRFYFNLVHHDRGEPIGHPVEDRGQAIAVAQRFAIDIAENRQDCQERWSLIFRMILSIEVLSRTHIPAAQKNHASDDLRIL